MKFKLTYHGPLKSNGRAADKHHIRLHFHRQLSDLWNFEPLKHRKAWIGHTPPTERDPYVGVDRIDHLYFASLIREDLGMFCQLDIGILTPNLGRGFGDIDNKLKTLFDALRRPNVSQEIPDKVAHNTPEDPIICLLDEDKLVRKFSVDVDRLLDARSDQEVSMVIGVDIQADRTAAPAVGLI